MAAIYDLTAIEILRLLGLKETVGKTKIVCNLKMIYVIAAVMIKKKKYFIPASNVPTGHLGK